MKCFNSKSDMFRLLIALMFLLVIGFPIQAGASDDLDELKEQIKVLQEKIEKLEKQSDWASEDIDDLNDRVDETEMHTATDKVSFGVEFRSRADSIHYDNIQMAPAQMVGAFFYTCIHGRIQWCHIVTSAAGYRADVYV